MGSIARGKLPNLIEELVHNPSDYDALQALHLIENNLGEEAVTGNPRQSFISMAPASELSFPAGEIRHCRVDETGRFRLELNFMGFYGVDSPLPQFFNDIAALETSCAAELRGFLELFNQRLYQLLYQAWKKMRLHSSSDTKASLYCRYLEALHGQTGSDRRLERFDYAGLLAGRVKNGQSLADMMEDFLGFPVALKQNIPCWIDVEETSSLGGSLVLGDNSMLGNRLMDVNSKVLLRIGPLPTRMAGQLLPGEDLSTTLTHMIREYLDPTIQYDVEILVQPDPDCETSLGDSHAILGWTTCLGHAGETINTIRLTGDSLDRQRHCSRSAA